MVRKAERSEMEESNEGLREANKREKAVRIRDAAMALFREKGFENTTTREVAQRAGIATGTLFLYVKTKEELVAFVFQDQIGGVVTERFVSLPRRKDIVDQLCHVFGGLIDWYAQEIELSRVILREVLFSRSDQPVMGFTLEFVSRVAELIDRAVERGELACGTTPSVFLAHHAFSLYLGAVLGVISGVADSKTALEMLRAALTIHFSGLRDSGPRKARKR